MSQPFKTKESVGFYLSRRCPDTTKLFTRLGFDEVDNILNADLVVIPHRSTSIHPMLYGQPLFGPPRPLSLRDDTIDVGCIRSFCHSSQILIGLGTGAHLVNAVFGNGSMHQKVLRGGTTGDTLLYPLDKKNNPVDKGIVAPVPPRFEEMIPGSEGVTLYGARLGTSLHEGPGYHSSVKNAEDYIHNSVIYYDSALAFEPIPVYTDEKYAALEDEFFETVDMYYLSSAQSSCVKAKRRERNQ